VDKLSQYRKHAEDCRALEKAAASEDERVALRNLAMHCDAIADLEATLRERRKARPATPRQA
jgi:hypothetical protein